jgi:hypothetical protein
VGAFFIAKLLSIGNGHESHPSVFVRRRNDEREPQDVTVNERDLLTEEFEGHRAHLRGVAYRMLGSLGEADDAVQESWLRLNRSDTSAIANLGARIDGGGVPARSRPPVVGAEAVARQILERGSRFARFARPALVNGAAGVIVAPGATPLAVVGFTVSRRRITEIDLIADPEKLRRLPTLTSDRSRS